MTVVERVAEAMVAADVAYRGRTYAEPWESLTVYQREPWLRLARAAIEAMREPSERMVEVGVGYAEGTLSQRRENAADGWRAMLAAALEERAP